MSWQAGSRQPISERTASWLQILVHKIEVDVPVGGDEAVAAVVHVEREVVADECLVKPNFSGWVPGKYRISSHFAKHPSAKRLV